MQYYAYPKLDVRWILLKLIYKLSETPTLLLEGVGEGLKTEQFVVIYWKCKEPTEIKAIRELHSQRTRANYSLCMEELNQETACIQT